MPENRDGYNEAAARIAECAKTGSEELRLSRLGLDTFPPEITKLTHLKLLTFSDNGLTELPREIASLKNLQHLDLTSNALKTLPAEVASLVNLEQLYLGHNQISHLPTEIGQLKSLTTLYIHNNRLEQLPLEIGTLVDLEGLTLGDNLFRRFPPQIGTLTSLKRLEFGRHGLREFPHEILSLRNLISLELANNRLQSIPSEISVLSKLTSLDVSTNELTDLPQQLGQIDRLVSLDLRDNEIYEFPDSIRKLKSLVHLNISKNNLRLLNGLGQCKSLEHLIASNNAILEVYEDIGELAYLKSLELSGNKLASLPTSISNLIELTQLSIDGNPLPLSHFDALGQGLDSLRALLASLIGQTEKLFEAKLLVTGEGKVGKSWTLAALRGADPEADIGDDNTTWGIERGSLSLQHPDFNKEHITFNTWDFGGQRIYRVTHQFFFSEQAIYLLVWNPRAGAEQCRVSEWLRTIALRTGSQLPRSAEPEAVPIPKAKVIMVATHAKDGGGSYVADYGRSSLDRDLRDMIVDEIEIDSRKGHNVDELKAMIARHASTLPSMGEPLNTSWAAAREATLSLQSTMPRITFKQFSDVCTANGVSDREQQRALAWTYLHSLGRAIWYGDESPDDDSSTDGVLADTIILDAVWLSRAFVQILDDAETAAAGGMLDHRRLRKIWTDHGRPEWHSYAPSEYEILKQVMRRFDVALPTRESGGRRSLVPQLVPQQRPAIPWTDAKQAPGPRTIRMRCELGFEAIGLMPRLIAATEPWHVYLEGVGLFWDRGIFLRDTASFKNEAVVLLNGTERPRIEIVVSGDRPEFLMHELYRTLETVLRFWKGMIREYSLGCPSIRSDGQLCPGLFGFESIVRRINERLEMPFNCQVCDSNWSGERLINGFEAMMVDDRYILHHLYHRDQLLAPRVCLLAPTDPSLLRITSWAGFVGKRLTLTLISELSGSIVKSKDFTLNRAWVKWVRPVTRVASLMLTGAALPFGGDLATAFKEESTMLDKLGTLPEEDSAPSLLRDHQEKRDMLLSPEEIANFAAFLAAIDLDPRKHGMDIARAPDGRWLWMSADEIRVYKPQPPA